MASCSDTFDICCTQENHATKVYKVFKHLQPLMYSEALKHLETDKDFQQFLKNTLVNCGYQAYCWEVIPVTQSTVVETPFVFAVTESCFIDKPANSHSFSEHFYNPTGKYATVFQNLRGDALLVSPLPCGSKNYSHLNRFLKNAPIKQMQELWKEVARSMKKQLKNSKKPFWLSTAGDGVPWLHFRIDSTPKYYVYSAMKELPIKETSCSSYESGSYQRGCGGGNDRVDYQATLSSYPITRYASTTEDSTFFCVMGTTTTTTTTTTMWRR